MRPTPPAHLTLAKALAADLEPGYYVRAQDLPAFAVSLTRQTKAMALYDYLESATRAVAREFVCGFVNDELSRRMGPGDGRVEAEDAGEFA